MGVKWESLPAFFSYLGGPIWRYECLSFCLKSPSHSSFRDIGAFVFARAPVQGGVMNFYYASLLAVGEMCSMAMVDEGWIVLGLCRRD